MNRNALTPSIAPSFPMTVADQAAHEKASFVRSDSGWFPTAADHPSQEDEAVRRVRESGRALRAGLAEYREFVGEAAA